MLGDWKCRLEARAIAQLEKAMLVRAEAGGHKADLTISGCKGGSSRLPFLQQSFLEASHSGVRHILWDATQPKIAGVYGEGK